MLAHLLAPLLLVVGAVYARSSKRRQGPPGVGSGATLRPLGTMGRVAYLSLHQFVANSFPFLLHHVAQVAPLPLVGREFPPLNLPCEVDPENGVANADIGVSRPFGDLDGNSGARATLDQAVLAHPLVVKGSVLQGKAFPAVYTIYAVLKVQLSVQACPHAGLCPSACLPVRPPMYQDASPSSSSSSACLHDCMSCSCWAPVAVHSQCIVPHAAVHPCTLGVPQCEHSPRQLFGS